LILVTGGTGFLGSYLVRYLVRDSFRVRVLKRPESDLSLVGEARDKVEWAEGDVLDITSLEEAMDGVKKVYHAAAVVSFHPSERKKMIKVNAEGTANVVNMALAKNVEKLLYVSSSSALRKPGTERLIDESEEPEKAGLDSFYGISKFLGEREVWRGIAEGLNAVIVNPAMLLGAGRWKDSSVRIFDTISRGQFFYPLGSNGYADVRDAARLIIQLMESNISGERFIISAENRTYQEVIYEIARSLNVRRPPFPLKAWLTPIAQAVDWLRAKASGTKPVFTSEVARIASASVRYDNQKIKSVLRYEFTPLSDVIEESADKFRKSRESNQSYAILELQSKKSTLMF